jgi:hypothetical protein
VDGPRSFSDDSEPRWYQGERGYADRYAEAAHGESGYGDDDRYRVPEPRGTGGHGAPRPGETGPPMSGPPMSGPAAPPGTFFPPRDRMEHTGETPVDVTGQRRGAERFDVSALRRPQGPAPSVYLSKRPGLTALLVVLTVAVEIPAFRAFASAAFAHRIDVSGTFASIFMILALPLFAMGMYGLIAGASTAPGVGARGWLRTPLAYLPISLLLFLAAALAV